MFYIISLPHQFTPHLHEYSSKEAFVKEIAACATEDIDTYADAIAYFTDDLHYAVTIESLDDLNAALQYDTNAHRGYAVRALAQDIDPSDLEA